MPLHPHHFPILQPSTFLHLPSSIRVHTFSSTAFNLAGGSHGPTYYEILDVPVTATTAEIKKKFYSLSLLHHPDRNPSDPKSSSKFSSISSAYHVLGNTSKRARYDRDNNIHPLHPHPHDPHHHHSHTRHSPHHHHGSFSSSSSAASSNSHVGSRPASGLSKRRGPFRGPPPSFYAHGGHGSSGRTTEPPPHYNTSTHTSSTTSHPHTKPSSSKSSPHDPSPFISPNAIPHFNATSHFRTQSHEDARRLQRRVRAREEERERRRAAGEDVGDEEGGNFARFLIVAGMLGVAGVVGGFMRSVAEAGGGGSGTGERRRKPG
ncbi:hypothetical protein FQN54_009623 [Arachnomyces sp. PD_36]|nr:hypothetical protein FQN54_009623 [Arachnomyces sp. PD_36]